MPRPSATPCASTLDTLASIEITRSRIACTPTFVSSKRKAPMMWFFSTCDWLSKNSVAWVKWSANFSGLPRTLSSKTGCGNDTKPFMPAWNGHPPPSEFGS